MVGATFDDLMLYREHQKQEKHRRDIEASEVIKRAEELIQELTNKPALNLPRELYDEILSLTDFLTALSENLNERRALERQKRPHPNDFVKLY